jgi:4-amino-4-deoxy-L-arabinose transferase-like glycosyltransferase
VLKWAALAVLAALALRFWYASFRPLVPDEAYYWSWSRHLSGGYFDHPPAIAYLIAASMRVFGPNELGVRGLGILLMAATVAMVLRVARDVGVGSRGRLLLLAVWLTSPLMAGLATVMTPDTPAAFFSVAMLAVAVRLGAGLERDPPATRVGWWLALGAATGLALLSKYTAVLTAAAVAAAFLTHPRGRRALARPGPWLAVLAAALVFTPVVVWNARHDWASFRFQLHHGLAERESNPVLGLLRFVGGQAGVWTPVLFGLGAVATVAHWRDYRRLSLAQRVLTWAATLPLVFFAYAAMRTHGEENWPDLAYFPMSVLTVRWVARDWQRRARAAWIGCAVALAAASVMHFPEVIRAAGLRMPVAMRNLFGWPELGAELGRVQAGFGADLILADKGQDAAEVAFYMPGRPEVWNYRPPGTKPFAYDYFEHRPDLRKARRILFIGNHADEFWREYDYEPVSSGMWSYRHGGRTPDRTRSYWLLVPKGQARGT